MELKRLKLFQSFFTSSLLIVPYGIETGIIPALVRMLFGLLIVPYGIETSLISS